MGQRTRKKRVASGTPKRGDEYQHAVAEVARSIEPKAEVSVGTWVDGPDGRRDLDVSVRSADAKQLLTVIECKDWSTPIGIAFIDALDSKRRDLGARVAMICSNSGFTSDALRKAARVGIPALSVLIKGDRRIRVVVQQQIYTRIITYDSHGPDFHYQFLSDNDKERLQGVWTKEFTHEGKSMESRVTTRLVSVAQHATKARSFLEHTRFVKPVSVHVRGLDLLLTGVDTRGSFQVQWMTQSARLDASKAMYDYLRKVIIFGPGQYQFDFTIDTQTWGTKVDNSEVPAHLLIPAPERPKFQGMSYWDVLMMNNIPQSDPKEAPDLEALVFSREVVDSPP